MLHEQFLEPSVAGLCRLRLAVDSNPGPPFLFLHGLTRRWATFLPLVPVVSQRFRPVLLDFRGHGDSDHRPPGEYHVVNYVDDVVRVIDALHKSDPLQRVVIYGHSLGAMAAAAAAERRPESVRAVILEDPPFDTMGSRLYDTPWGKYFATLIEYVGLPLPPVEYARRLASVQVHDPITGRVATLGEVRDAASLRFMAAGFRTLDRQTLQTVTTGQWLAGYHRDEIFERVRCPILLLQADAKLGGMLTDEEAAAVQIASTDCTLVRMQGVSHVVHQGKPTEVGQLVATWLESLGM
jgi:pimeloyl-ACP methyl ester carboxylesterase